MADLAGRKANHDERMLPSRAKGCQHALVGRALQDKIPRTRYLVGTDARAVRLLARLPDRLRDVLLAADRSG
jgi:hypothetical protein